MKKRIFILVSSILCVLVTVSLVTYTLVGVFSKKANEPAPEVPPTIDTTVEQEDELTSNNQSLTMIVGDIYDGSILSTENYTGSLLAPSTEGKLIASVPGTESVAVRIENVVYAFNITVFAKGEGSQENPYNIIRPQDLIQLASENVGNYAYYVQQCDLDLSGYASWVPVGNLATPFIGSYDGNNYAIKNMNIAVTNDNKDDYIHNAQTVGTSNGTMLTAGFFGFVGDPMGNSVSQILNVNIHDAKVDTTAIETAEILDSTQMTQSYVGVLAGFVRYTTVAGGEGAIVTSNINSSLYCDKTTSTAGAVSAFIGGSASAELSGYTIKSNITAKNPGTVTKTDNGYVYYGTTIAGILGRNSNTSLNNFTVQMSVNARNYENTSIAGAVGFIVEPTNVKDIKISNINVESLYVTLTQYSYTSTKTGIIAGAVVANYNTACTLENISVSNILVNAIGSAQVAGIIDTNYGTITNATVSGQMKGTIVAGVVNTNYGTIAWNENATSLYAVDVDLRGQIYVAGVAVYNYGKLVGSTELTQIKAVLNWSPVIADFNKIKDNAMMAGVAVVSAGANSAIENFFVATDIINPVNAGGVVGTFGSYTETRGESADRIYEGGSIKNVDVNARVITIASPSNATANRLVYSGKTNIVGGVVAKVGKTTAELTIADVRGVINVNRADLRNSNSNYALNVYGTIIGYAESNVKISQTDASATIDATLFTNETSAEVQYVGTAIGLKANGVKISAGSNVKVNIYIEKTADGAKVNTEN